MSDLIVDLAFQHLAELYQNGCAPERTNTRPNLFGGAGLGIETHAARKVIVTDEGGKDKTHVCSEKCHHVRLNNEGFFTCTLSGVVYNAQFSNGSFDVSRQLDDIAGPSNAKRQKRKWNAENFYELILSSSTATLNTLFNKGRRDSADLLKHDKAKRYALRAAATHFDLVFKTEPGTQPNTLLEIMNDVYSVFEQNGGPNATGVDRIIITPDKIYAIALISAMIYGQIIVPFILINSKKPTNQYYSVAVQYMLAAGHFGTKLQFPILQSCLPDEKGLPHLGYVISRMTSAKRYILDALNHYVTTKTSAHSRMGTSF